MPWHCLCMSVRWESWSDGAIIMWCPFNECTWWWRAHHAYPSNDMPVVDWPATVHKVIDHWQYQAVGSFSLYVAYVGPLKAMWSTHRSSKFSVYFSPLGRFDRVSPRNISLHGHYLTNQVICLQMEQQFVEKTLLVLGWGFQCYHLRVF